MTDTAPGVTGWDVGGVNTKVARARLGALLAHRSVPFEIQRAPDELAPLLARLASSVGSEATDHHAVTMTAELSQFFESNREGVDFVLAAFERAFPGALIQLFGTDGAFHGPLESRREPLLVAASNRTATGTLVARKWPDVVLIDIGSTTTDIIPIRGGEVAALGRTDPDRLRSGELLYLGALRTPVEAIVHEVPSGGGSGGDSAGVSAESFAIAADVYIWLGELEAAGYTVPTPDGRAADRAGARARLARVVCADGEMLDDGAIDGIARHVARVQAERVARSLERVLARHPSVSKVITAGVGSFIARRAVGLLPPEPLSVEELGAGFTPAAAVALLLDAQRDGCTVPSHAIVPSPVNSASPLIDTVVKVGGALLGRAGALPIVVAALRRVAERGDPVLIVPGGGPFADVVRGIDTDIGLPDDTAHWMAVLALDQYAELLASRIPGSEIVRTREEAHQAIAAGRLPVLAPAAWLRRADPPALPHSWDVTSDSIAAWAAGQVGARRLVLAKAVRVEVATLVDPHFSRALPAGVESLIVEPAELARALGVSPAPPD
jgi:probable H4MPT-linked C1 transfer pathway protein